MTNPTTIARSLSEAQRAALVSAKLADCHEWWLTSNVDDPRLAGEDWVLSELGVAVRAAILAEQDGGA